MHPPIPALSPVAYASAAHVPDNWCFGHIVRTGGIWVNHCMYILMILCEDDDNFLFEELGSRMRSQTLLSDNEQCMRSALDCTG